MPFDDLDLEFEDEEESKKKKNDAVHVDVDLEFHTPEGAKARPQPAPRPATAGTAPNIQRPAGVVRKIDDARPPTQQVRRPAPTGTQPQMTAPRSVGSSALREEPHYDVESEQVVELREKMRKVEFDAEVKVQVAEFKTEILSELLGDMKLMEHQIGQLLARINAKHPDMKNEALMIKKILADFTAKKRK